MALRADSFLTISSAKSVDHATGSGFRVDFELGCSNTSRSFLHLSPSFILSSLNHLFQRNLIHLHLKHGPKDSPLNKLLSHICQRFKLRLSR
jgi:hypothetical protein